MPPLPISLLVAVVLASFAALVFVGSSGVHPEYLLHQDWSRVPSTVPVLYIALVFHNVIPVVTTQLEGEVMPLLMPCAIISSFEAGRIRLC